MEKNIGKYYKIIAKKYFIKDYPINITQVYQKWYCTRLCDNQEDFNIQLNNNIIAELLFINSYTKYIKGALVIITQKIKKKKLILKRMVRLYSISKSNIYKIIAISKRDIQQIK